MKRVLCILGIYFVFSLSPAVAERLAQCGASEGYAYFIEGPLVPKDKSGWDSDRISSGSTSIIAMDGKIDILFTDASGITQSSLEEGAEISLIGTSEVSGSFSLLVTYEGHSAAIYTYSADTNQLFFFTQKYGALVNLSRILVSDCI